MTKRKTRRRANKLFNSLSEIAEQSEETNAPESGFPVTGPQDGFQNSAFRATLEGGQEAGELVRMKKFRFQLFSQWLIEHYEPCRAADVGGGKGLLTYLLRENDWEAAVIDPFDQPLPDKYKDIAKNKRVKIPPTKTVPRISQEFEPEMARDYDLLLGMHAHGCNVKIIDASAEYKKNFVLLPCCIIDEPIYPEPGVHWLECLMAYAVEKGFAVYPFRLNFRGQNIGFCSIPGRE